LSIPEQRLRVEKTARYYVLGEAGPAVREVWVCCHGYGQLAGRFIKHFDPVAEPTRLIVAPEALHRFYLDPADRPASERRVGATWMTREDRTTDIEDYVRYLDVVCERVLTGVPAGVQLVALGFSQGAATVARWAAASRYSISTLVLWGSGLPPDLDWLLARGRFQRMRVVLVGGEADRQMPASSWAEQQTILGSQQVGSEIIRFPGGHQIDGATLRRLVPEAP
jgi:predicted esterase